MMTSIRVIMDPSTCALTGHPTTQHWASNEKGSVAIRTHVRPDSPAKTGRKQASTQCLGHAAGRRTRSKINSISTTRPQWGAEGFMARPANVKKKTRPIAEVRSDLRSLARFLTQQ